MEIERGVSRHGVATVGFLVCLNLPRSRLTCARVLRIVDPKGMVVPRSPWSYPFGSCLVTLEGPIRVDRKGKLQSAPDVLV